MSYVANHLMPGEEVVREARLSRIIYLPAAILLALSVVQFVEIYRGGTEARTAMPVPVFFVALAAIAAIPAFIRRSSCEFAVTSKRVVVKVGFLRRHSTEILLRQVEGITVDQGLLGRIFGFGTIVVEGTGSDRTPYKASPRRWSSGWPSRSRSRGRARGPPPRRPRPGPIPTSSN
jgi:membrane protein YdbS with pleckstrin-like domain